ncbi:MAG: hypothetical protein DDT32_01085 [Syntrophomonadaceae bacterium]|nr:hypothetical protein [Bacillota bacterium]
MGQPPHFRIDGAIYFVTTRLKEKGTSLDANERTIAHQNIYIHNNAVRNRLAEVAEDYPYSSARAYKDRYGEVFYLEGRQG